LDLEQNQTLLGETISKLEESEIVRKSAASEIEGLKRQIGETESSMSTLNSQLETLRSDLKSRIEESDQLKSQNESLAVQLEEARQIHVSLFEIVWDSRRVISTWFSPKRSGFKF
jgi:predicted transcriptional regulator